LVDSLACLINSYIIEHGVCYLVLCEKSFSKRLAFSYLEDIAQEFGREHLAEVSHATRPYAFIEFGKSKALLVQN
jgi:vesicle transport protein SEC22